ncbi:hypothetical protein GCM10012289_49850 [Nonomuraea cavernae]|uniref:Uncharacterized protein n=1 Tax=Nonomuraea cavernae TaxID=2045107 RepID=A0A918DMN0_9ACTN|nr:hypothetical protein GCM10012289_49850 [Nonomuraea cavernae]
MSVVLRTATWSLWTASSERHCPSETLTPAGGSVEGWTGCWAAAHPERRTAEATSAVVRFTQGTLGTHVQLS